jgi:hypothetical protein
MSAPRRADHPDPAYVAAAAEDRLARAQAQLEADRQRIEQYLAGVLSRTHDSLLADQIWSGASQ